MTLIRVEFRASWFAYCTECGDCVGAGADATKMPPNASTRCCGSPMELRLAKETFGQRVSRWGSTWLP